LIQSERGTETRKVSCTYCSPFRSIPVPVTRTHRHYAVWGANEPGIPDAAFFYFTNVRIAAAFVDHVACGMTFYAVDC
jgi:hypothetical protein